MKKPDQKRHQKQAPPTPLTAEQQAQAKAAFEKAQAEAKVREEQQRLYDASIPHMSRNQIRAELRKKAKSPEANLLTAAFAIVLGTVYENTQTDENPNAKLGSYPR